MKTIYLFLWGLAFIVSCQQRQYNHSSDSVDSLSSSVSPTLLAFQFMTVGMRRDKSKWAETANEYIQNYGDNAKDILADFIYLEFKNQNDTLIVNYSLKDLRQESNYTINFTGNYQIELAGKPSNENSLKYKFESNVEQIKDNKKFKAYEGKFTLFETNQEVTHIIHEFRLGTAKNKITHTEQ